MRAIKAFFAGLLSSMSPCGFCRRWSNAELAVERAARKRAEQNAIAWESEARALRLEIFGVPDSMPRKKGGAK